MFPFILQHLEPGSFGALPFLAADFLNPLLLFARLAANHCFYFIGENSPGEKAVDGLGAFPLALHLNLSGEVLQIDTARSFVDFLAALAAGADEFFEDIFFKDAQAFHPLAQGILFFFAHTESNHLKKGDRPLFIEKYL